MERSIAEFILPDLYEPKRWMCSKCGLILDYLFSPDVGGWPEFEPPLHAVDIFVDDNGTTIWEEPERKELCPRCNADFEKIPLIPIVISEFAFKPFAKATFMVEDSAHKVVIENIAKLLGKDIDIIPLGNSDNVRRFFDEFKKQNLLDKGFFVIDGDNKPKIFPDEIRFIHLDKYCIENYLLDVQICAVIFNKPIDEISKFILDDLKSSLIQANNAFAILANLLTTEHVNEAALSGLDGSKILNKLLKHANVGLNEYAGRYIEECNRQGRLDTIFSKKLVDSINNVA